MQEQQTITTTVDPRAYLRNLRKEMNMTQDEFAELFVLSKDCYRKYEDGQRNITENVYRMMLRILEYHRKKVEVENFSTFLEEIRQECLTSIFCEEKHEIVNIIFDYLLRKVERVMK